MLGHRGVHFHLAGQHTLLLRLERAPRLHHVRHRRELRAGRDRAELDLPGQRLLAQLLPALVELALVFVNPLPRHMMRVVRARCRVVDEEWLVRRQRLLRADPDDGLVGDVGADVVVRIARRGDAGHAIVQRRGVEVRLALKEAVELVETGVRRPTVHRPGDTQFPRRQLVALAEHRGAVAVEPQNLRQRCDGLGTLAVHAGKRGAHFGHAAHVRAVRVAAREQRDTRRRADRRGVHVVVAQAAFGKALEGRHVDRPAEASRIAEPEIVHQDEDDVGCARPFGWLQLEARRRRGLACIDFGDRRMLWLRQGQNRTVRRLVGRVTHGWVSAVASRRWSLADTGLLGSQRRCRCAGFWLDRWKQPAVNQWQYCVQRNTNARRTASAVLRRKHPDPPSWSAERPALLTKYRGRHYGLRSQGVAIRLSRRYPRSLVLALDRGSNDFPPSNASRCEPVNVGVCRRFRADHTQFLHSSRSRLRPLLEGLCFGKFPRAFHDLWPRPIQPHHIVPVLHPVRQARPVCDLIRFRSGLDARLRSSRG